MRSLVGVTLVLSSTIASASEGERPPSTLSSAEINAVIKTNAKQIRGCYQRELDKLADLSGKLVVKFKINAMGNVSSAELASTTMKSPAVENCVLAEFRKLTFPAKGGAIVSYPLIFTKGS